MISKEHFQLIISSRDKISLENKSLLRSCPPTPKTICNLERLSKGSPNPLYFEIKLRFIFIVKRLISSKNHLISDSFHSILYV